MPNVSDMTPERLRLQERYEHLKMLRTVVDPILRDSQRFINPQGTDFYRERGPTVFSGQEDGSKELYDDTAIWAKNMFASAMASYLFPKSQRWAYLKPVGIPSADLDDEQMLYLENLSNAVHHALAIPQSRFYPSGHEAMGEIGSYGNGPVFVQKRDGAPINFKATPLADTFFDVDDEGTPDTVFFRKYLSTKALAAAFPAVLNMEGFDAKATSKQYELVYSVEPNRDVALQRSGRVGAGRRWKVTYWTPDLKGVIQTGGISYFPFLIPRWMLISGEVYGRGPASNILATIRLANKAQMELILAAEMSNSPPLQAEDDQIVMPFAYGSRKVVLREPGSPPIEPLLSGSQPEYLLQVLQRCQEQITRAFFVDQIVREQKRERQSVLEIQDERGQMLQQLGPTLARFESEFLSPAVELTVMMLRRQKLLPEPPESLRGLQAEVVFTSPAAQAQYSGRVQNLQAFLQDMAQMAAAKPDILDVLDEQEIADVLSRYRDVPRSTVVSKDELAKIREQRAQAEQAQMGVQGAADLSGALKNVAQAKQADPEGIGQLLAPR